jgi:hypothetical protein
MAILQLRYHTHDPSSTGLANEGLNWRYLQIYYIKVSLTLNVTFIYGLTRMKGAPHNFQHVTFQSQMQVLKNAGHEQASGTVIGSGPDTKPLSQKHHHE